MIGDFLSTDTLEYDLTTFKIKVDGRPVSEEFPLMEFSTQHAVNSIPKATIVFHDGDVAAEDFVKTNIPAFAKGKSIEIQVGYHFDEKLIFKGVITQQRITGKARECTYLHLECQHEAYKMVNRREDANFKALEEAKIFKKILNKYKGIKNNVNTIKENFEKEVVQPFVRDWDFLVSRAEKICSYIFIDEKGELTIKKPELNKFSGITLKYGEDIFDFDLESDCKNQFTEVHATAWDSVRQTLVTAISKITKGLDIGNTNKSDFEKITGEKVFHLKHGGVIPKNELQCLADAQMQKIQLSKIKGTLKCYGRADIHIGDVIAIEGFGEQFTGRQFFVSGVAHQLQKSNWKTTLQVGLDAAWHHEKYDIQPPPSAGFSPSMQGIQVGKVLNIHEDPKKEHRVQINLPTTGDNQEQGTWARLSTLDAGDKRGSLFRPEVSDEVIVGFVNNDPNQAVILGQLPSKKHPPPVIAEEKNSQKGFVTRQELKIIFDDEKKQILIQTPAGKQIFLDEKNKAISIEDEYKNKMTFDQKGISFESEKDIVLKAPKGKVELIAKNINIDAKMNLKATAGMNALFEGKTKATLNGQIVMIN